ncbi:deuterosome assembly protein 1 isoform X2 [Eleutherodactylus coqui]|uniref:deuterosome assembly protein 1 isoform X2 n=1 Tax=Eleutherodactylus coqui TaxID=57060 RepID=UPI003462D7FE
MGDSSCENELQELMHQIDIMVNSKKVEWEKRVRLLQQRLEAQEREIARSRCAVEEKDGQIGVLTKKLEAADKSQYDVVKNYETQLDALKDQLCKLKKSYDKLHYYHVKNHKRDDGDSSPAHEKSPSELHCLSQKLEQSQSYQAQVSGRTQPQDQAITNNPSEIRRLRCQLDASQETIRSGRVIIENLKSTVKEITLSRNSLKDENRRLLQELRDCQKQCQRTEDKLSDAMIERQAREDLSRAAELDQRRLCKFTWQSSQENKLSSQEAGEPINERTPNREQAQKRLKLSPCKQDQPERHSSTTEIRNAGFERLQADISDLNEKLHQKDITITTIKQKVSRLERELDMKEPGNLQQFLKSAEESYHFHDLTREPEMNRPLKLCSDGYELKGLQPEMIKPVSLHKEIIGKQSQGKQCRSHEEEEQSLMMADNDTNNNLICYHPCDSMLVDQECLEDILPKLRSPTQNDHLFHEMDFTDFSFLVGDQSGDATLVPDTEESFVSAAERFLQEENRRALDFENILNSHIEELQRYSEHTVKKYAAHRHRDYRPAPS